MGQPIELIAGLGNPDPEYLATRHNAGFWLLDHLAGEHGVRFAGNKKLDAAAAEIRIGDQRLRLLKPLTFMNESGSALSKAAHYFKIPPDKIMVCYDELDLPPGTARLKFGGGHAGHNGMRSIIAHLGADFWRLRIGVGHPGQKSQVTGHVLRRAPSSEEELILNAIRRAIEVLPVFIEQGAERAMTRLHSDEAD